MVDHRDTETQRCRASAISRTSDSTVRREAASMAEPAAMTSRIRSGRFVIVVGSGHRMACDAGHTVESSAPCLGVSCGYFFW